MSLWSTPSTATWSTGQTITASGLNRAMDRFRSLRQLNEAAVSLYMNTTGQSVSNDHSTGIDWTNAIWNLGDTAMWSSATPSRVTAQIPGWYRIEGTVVWAKESDGYRQCHLREGGTSIFDLGVNQTISVDSTGRTRQGFYAEAYLTSGAYFELMVKHLAGNPLTVMGGKIRTRMQVTLVGTT